MTKYVRCIEPDIRDPRLQKDQEYEVCDDQDVIDNEIYVRVWLPTNSGRETMVYYRSRFEEVNVEAAVADAFEAKRFNTGKPQISLPLSARYALEGAAEVMAFGAQKYGRDNWKKGLSVENLTDSMARHLIKYLEGEDKDDESGCHHLDHVLCNALFLAYHHNGKKPTQ